MNLPEKEQKYTYADYLTWSQKERWEIIAGIPRMQAAPSWQHQVIARELLTQFNLFLKNKPCQVFAAPFDLRIPERNETDLETSFVVQPDLVVICERNGLKGTGYFGVPRLIIEISSPATARNDKVYKFNKYETAGVEEYWIVEPDGKFVSVFTLQEGHYGRPATYTESEIIKVSVFAGELEINLAEIFLFE